MIENILTFILSIYGFYWGGFLALMIYLIIRKKKIKAQEKFEDREN